MQDNAAIEAAATAEAAGAAAVSGLIALVVYVVIGIIYAIVVYIVARKRGVNPWVWAIPTLIPFIGVIVGAIFMLLSFLSVLDRLNVLEKRDAFT